MVMLLKYLYKLLQDLFKKQHYRWAKQRLKFFLKVMRPNAGAAVLDLGGAAGDFFYSLKSMIRKLDLKITIADIDSNALKVAKARGFAVLHIEEGDLKNIPSESYDMVFCNSVIEHVTIPKQEIWACDNGKDFRKAAFRHQAEFAYDIMRIGRAYFVETPHKHFPVESHTWLPLASFLPRKVMIGICRWTKSHWLKATSPDWNLLTPRRMQVLFKDADAVVLKRIFFLAKEIIAYKL